MNSLWHRGISYIKPMSETFIANSVLPEGSWDSSPLDKVVLDYKDRFIRRKMLTGQKGTEVLVSLESTVSLNEGDGLKLSDGQIVEVVAAVETVIEIRAGDSCSLARLAWHIGNRHTPCQIEDEFLLILHDHVMEDMLKKLGASTSQARRPFTPEGGAYGHGRTHAHDHAPKPGSHGHSHD